MDTILLEIRVNTDFFRFPAIIVNQGQEIRELSEQRRTQWFANIYRKEFDNKKAETLEFVAFTLFLVSK